MILRREAFTFCQSRPFNGVPVLNGGAELSASAK
jgi:hypothetical protein